MAISCPVRKGQAPPDLRYFTTTLHWRPLTTNCVGIDRYAGTTAIAVISTMISGTAKAAAVSNVLAGNCSP